MCIKQSILFYVEQVNTPVEDYTWPASSGYTWGERERERERERGQVSATATMVTQTNPPCIPKPCWRQIHWERDVIINISRAWSLCKGSMYSQMLIITK